MAQCASFFECLNKWFYCIVQQIDGSYLYVSPHRVGGISKRLEGFTQSFHCVLYLHVGLGSAIGCCFDIVAGLAHLLADDRAHSLGHVAGFLHLILDLGSTQSKVIQDHKRFTAQSGYDTIYHVVYTLTSIFCLLLGKRQHGTKLFDRQLEVVELDSSLHQLNICNCAMCGLAQSIQDITSAKALKGYAYAFALARQLYSMLNRIAQLHSEACAETGCLGHNVTAEYLQHAIQLAVAKKSAAVQLAGVYTIQAAVKVVYLCLSLAELGLKFVDRCQVLRAYGFLLRLSKLVVLCSKLL